MKKILFFCCFLLIYIPAFSQVGIMTETPDPSANLHVSGVSGSTFKGSLMSPLTTTERLAIANPAPGLMVYDTTIKCLMTNNGTAAAPVWECSNGNTVRSLGSNQIATLVTPPTGTLVYNTDVNCLTINTGTAAAPIWECTTDNGTVSTRHFYYKFDYAKIATSISLYQMRTGTMPAASNTTNLSGYLRAYDPTRLADLPVIGSLRMDIGFYSKSTSAGLYTYNPLLVNTGATPITGLSGITSAVISGSFRLPTNLSIPANGGFLNVDADFWLGWDTSSYTETSITHLHYNGKMYRLTYYGFSDGTTHSIHLMMEVFD